MDPQFPDLSDILTEPIESVSNVTENYFAGKAREFQALLSSLEATDREVRMLIAGLSETPLREALRGASDELSSRKTQLKLTAEAINFVVHGLKPLGISLPSIQLPSTLGAIPLAVAGAAAAAVAAASALIVWGVTWIEGVNDRLRDQALLEGLPEADRVAVAQAIIRTQAEGEAAANSPLQSIAGIAKWVAIAAIAYFAYQAVETMRDEA